MVIDGSESAIPTFATTREDVIHIEPMTIEIMRSIPEYATLLNRLDEVGLMDAVWAVIGGVPSQFDQLSAAITKAKAKENADLESVVDVFVMGVLETAKRRINTMLRKNHTFKSVTDQFQVCDSIVLKPNDADLPTPNVFRVVGSKTGNDDSILIPVNAAVGFKLHHPESLTFADVKKLVAEEKARL